MAPRRQLRAEARGPCRYRAAVAQDRNNGRSGVDAPLPRNRSERIVLRWPRGDLHARLQQAGRRDGGGQCASARRQAVRARRLHPQVPDPDGWNHHGAGVQPLPGSGPGAAAPAGRGPAPAEHRRACRHSRNRQAWHFVSKEEFTMSETTTEVPVRAKRGVALSGVTAGNTALCTVGRSGNDLHYRGYDILDVADTCEFEEIAYLLV